MFHMKNIFKIVKSAVALTKELLVGVLTLLKFILVRCWKFFLLIGSIFLTLFSVKKASKGD